MTRFLIDTNVISELAKSEPADAVVAWIQSVPVSSLYLSVVSLSEMYFGIRRLPRGKKRSLLEVFIADELAAWFGRRVLPVTIAIADKWADLRVTSELRGRRLPLADGLIAATAMQRGLVLVTRNTSDFQIDGLAVVNPWPDDPVVQRGSRATRRQSK